MIHPTTLACGANALIERESASKSAAIGFWFPQGSRFESENERGFSHMVEHMLFKGTTTRSAFDIAREIDRVGGYLNAFTEREATCVHCTVPAGYAELAIEILADMCFFSVFPESEFDKERQVIRSEILSAQDDPEEAANDAFLAAIWGNHPLARKIGGEPADIEAADRESVFAFYRERYVASSLLVAVAGNIDPDTIIHKLESVLPRESLPKPRFVSTAPAWNRVWRYRRSSQQQVQIFLGAQSTRGADEADFYTASVFSSSFGESMSSRLFQNLRERRGLCYTIYSYLSYAQDVSLWTIYASTTIEHAATLVRAMIEQVRGLDGGGLTELEIAEAKSHLEVSMLMASEDVENRMKRLARQWLFCGRVYDVHESIGLLSSVTKPQVDDMVQRLMHETGPCVFAYGPWRARRCIGEPITT